MKKIILLFVVFWNVENFFDYRNTEASLSDEEFSPAGVKHWTADRFYTKCSAIAKTLYYISNEHMGRMPDIICFAEVENKFVLSQLWEHTTLRKIPYRAIHYESADARGIDVDLLYREDRMRAVHSQSCRIDGLTTRDILLVQFITHSGDSLSVLVNHHPSKYGGKTSDARLWAVTRLKTLCDSLDNAGWFDRLAIGDFNDVPSNEIYSVMEEKHVNLAAPLAARGEGSIKFNGTWELIDQAFVSRHLADRASMKVEYVPFLLVPDKGHSGMKPYRTYTGPAYAGGVSDHCPISVEIE